MNRQFNEIFYISGQKIKCTKFTKCMDCYSYRVCMNYKISNYFASFFKDIRGDCGRYINLRPFIFKAIK